MIRDYLYQGKNGYFRINAARLIDYQPKQQVNNQFINQQININQSILLWNDKNTPAIVMAINVMNVE